ncbi:phosphatase PAP2 family protein [Parasulfuritortus cantonensis]|uniref:Phosphatase PAP2 family protein n=2 Tax=Parasulfuritortus cantonensis TaxID=2528202 RepID=A0A4R1BMC9_9PROT|nr:phosphatase PAP2 family protein [Parasulfuritortus cantonensis]
MAVSALVLAAVFLAFPQLDRLSSAALYRPDGFLLRGSAVFDFVHDYVGVLAWLGALAALAILLGAKRLPRLAAWRRPAAYMLLVLLLGPGLLVNAVLKDHWGRARPVQTVEFGGAAQFTPAWVVSDQCRSNCSFVCGDASIGFSLLGLAFVSRRPRRWLAAGILLGGGLGLMRMAQGGHFLSDVIFSFYATWFAAWLLARLIDPLGTRAGRLDSGPK